MGGDKRRARCRARRRTTTGSSVPIVPDTSATLGDGDGVDLTRLNWPDVRSMAVTSDGALVLASEDGDTRIRTVVPADSPRLRVAVLQQTYTSLATGTVGYLAGAAGTLTLEVRAGGRVVIRTVSRVPAGTAVLALPSPPRPGAYDLRLRLRTRAAVTEGRAHVDLRTLWPLSEAAAAVRGTTGDEGGGAGTELGPCRRVAARVADCVILEVEYGNNLEDIEYSATYTAVPAAVARVALRDDGRATFESQPVTPTRLPPGLVVNLPARQRLSPSGLRVKGRCLDSGKLTVAATLLEHGGPGHATVRAHVSARCEVGIWSARLRMNSGEVATAKRWLRRGRIVTARVVTTAGVAAGVADAVRIETRSTRLG